MADDFAKLNSRIVSAAAAGQLNQSSAQNISALLRGAPPLYREVINELVEAQAWSELNDRFYKTLAFGTGGLRGRTIGRIVTRAERGSASKEQRPEFPCIGTNAMNFYNVSRATQGLVAYVKEWRAAERIAGKAKIVIAYDTRHFSREFADLAANVAAENGCDACVFDGPRSTPELSFAVRHLKASAGIVITASHNPPQDNGYKVYFDDGAQVVEPHAGGIIRKVNAIESESFPPLSPNECGSVAQLGREIDEAYMARLETLVLNPALVGELKTLRIVFTPIHGTGSAIIKPMLRRLGFSFETVREQDQLDGDFPTVKSPNPENAEALALGIKQAQRSAADLVIATDPDCDRMGVAVRTASDEMKLLTGNQIGSLLAYYRAKTLFEAGVLNKENAGDAVIIKTFVTTDLQKAIAKRYGLRCVETLTGFKYIGAKLGKYERALPAEVVEKYRELPEEETRKLRLEYSSFYVFGGEESYGYSGADFVRDKDGNGAAIMFCEVAAYAKSRDLTIAALLDEVFATFGYYQEKNAALTFEGAEGADKIKRLVESYVSVPPSAILGADVTQMKDFAKETFYDVEGDEIPKEKMLIFELADRTRIAVRGSGTEPKIKYYLFAERQPTDGKFTAAQLRDIKTVVGAHLDLLWEWLREDAARRLSA